MITLKGLSKSFGKFKVLDNISIDFKEGNVVAVMGPNGSGKTTLLKCILSLVIPDAGEIIVDGVQAGADYSYKDKIGYMPQFANYPGNLKVREIFDILKEIRDDKKEYDEELVESFKVRDVFEKKFSQLSGGMRQRVSGALAFLFDAPIIILDEPTAGLDPLAAEIIKAKIFKERQKGKLIILTSHLLTEVDEIADRLIFLLEGKVKLDTSILAMKNGHGESLGSIVYKYFNKEEKNEGE